MTAGLDTLPRPGGPDGGGDEDDFDHIYCCDRDRSLCGLDLAGVEDVGEVGDESLCPWCEVLSDLDVPCGAAGCSNRGRL